MDVKPLSSIENASQAGRAPRRTQAERRAEAESNLLAAAARLIANGGLGRISLAQIGLEAGYSRGLVNHHFGSKARLIERLVENVRDEFASAVAASTDSGSALERILGLTRTFLGMLDRLPSIHRAFLVLWAGASVAPPEIRQAMAHSDRTFRSEIADVVEAGIRGGEIREDVNAAGFATILVGQLRGISLQVLIDPEGVDLGQVRKEMERHISGWLVPARPTVTKVEDGR